MGLSWLGDLDSKTIKALIGFADTVRPNAIDTVSMLRSMGIDTMMLTGDSRAAAKKLYQFLDKEYKDAAVKAFVETAYFASLSGTNQQFTFAILIVTVVMAIGGVFGVMNTMFAAISQRTKDIGVLRILGFARR